MDQGLPHTEVIDVTGKKNPTRHPTIGADSPIGTITPIIRLVALSVLFLLLAPVAVILGLRNPKYHVPILLTLSMQILAFLLYGLYIRLVVLPPVIRAFNSRNSPIKWVNMDYGTLAIVLYTAFSFVIVWKSFTSLRQRATISLPLYFSASILLLLNYMGCFASEATLTSLLKLMAERISLP